MLPSKAPKRAAMALGSSASTVAEASLCQGTMKKMEDPSVCHRDNGSSIFGWFFWWKKIGRSEHSHHYNFHGFLNGKSMKITWMIMDGISIFLETHILFIKQLIWRCPTKRGTQIAGWCVVENPTRIDDLRGPHFGKAPLIIPMKNHEMTQMWNILGVANLAA